MIALKEESTSRIPYIFLVSAAVFAFFALLCSSAPVQAATTRNVTELAAGTDYATKLYTIKSSRSGPTVLLVGGIHGNERSGPVAARKYTSANISRGTLLVIPEANRKALDLNKRKAPGELDLNRAFPRSSKDKADNRLARDIYQVAKDYNVDWVIDLHEGYDYYRRTSTDSVGQTVIYYPRGDTRDMALAVVHKLNSKISTSYRQFKLLRYPVQGSLTRATGQYLGAHSFIMETCSKDRLSTRVNRNTETVDTLLTRLNML